MSGLSRVDSTVQFTAGLYPDTVGMAMHDDIQAIRDTIKNWMQATLAGDLPRILSLMTEDVVFLTPGNPPMRGREGFAAAFNSMGAGTQISGEPDIQEIQVNGDWGYCWNFLRITATPPDGRGPIRVSGNILSIFRKNPDGEWQLWRDANLLMGE
jgi:uncharacterized protein (TIGR02246 family)